MYNIATPNPTYHTIRSSGLDFKLNTTNGIILGKEVLGGLTNIVKGN